MSIIPRDCRKYIESDPTAECGCVQCKQDEETRRQIKAQAPSTSKCCEKCYDPYSTQGYEVDSPCGNPNCPCHTTHNQEESVIVRDLTIDILPQYKVERLGTLQEAVEKHNERMRRAIFDAETKEMEIAHNQEEGKYWPLGSKIPIEVTKTTTKFKLADGNTLILHSDGGFQLEIPERNQEEWEKSCTQCGVFKPLAEFYRKSTSLDGYNYYCKQCYLKYDASRYYGNKGKRLEKDRARYHRDKTSSIESKKRQKEKYPEKEKARQAVRNAIYLGKIKRLPCVKCGDEKSHAHHEDYKKPFDVVWLCRKHHMELHRKYERVS